MTNIVARAQRKERELQVVFKHICDKNFDTVDKLRETGQDDFRLHVIEMVRKSMPLEVVLMYCEDRLRDMNILILLAQMYDRDELSKADQAQVLTLIKKAQRIRKWQVINKVLIVKAFASLLFADSTKFFAIAHKLIAQEDLKLDSHSAYQAMVGYKWMDDVVSVLETLCINASWVTEEEPALLCSKLFQSGEFLHPLGSVNKHLRTSLRRLGWENLTPNFNGSLASMFDPNWREIAKLMIDHKKGEKLKSVSVASKLYALEDRVLRPVLKEMMPDLF